MSADLHLVLAAARNSVTGQAGDVWFWQEDVRKLNKIIRISDLASFCTAFGSLGLRGGRRTGLRKRTQEDEEWFVMRRFLKTALRGRIFEPPLSIQKRNPPEPDFSLELGDEGGSVAFLEITEATDPADQKEMTKFERSNNSAMLLGDFGGRFSRGASQPGRAWASDVLEAIKRKQDKAIFIRSDATRHLVIYPNSNASKLLTDHEEEHAAFGYLKEAIEENRNTYVRAANGCLVHVLGKEYLGFDLLGNVQLVRRE